MKDVSVFDNLTLQGDCSKQTVQHKKKISDQASACTQRDDRKWKYQKKSVAAGLVCKLSGVQSSRRELSNSEAAVAQRSEFVKYLRINGQP